MTPHIHTLSELCAIHYTVNAILISLAIVIAWTIWDVMSDAGEHRANYRNIQSQLSAIEDFYASADKSATENRSY